MPIIDHIDGPNRDIYLHADTVGVSVHPIDIYKEMRTLRRTDETLRKFDIFLEAKGNDPKGSGKFTERYVICLDGTRIVPYDTSHTLTVTGVIITDDGQEGIACFDRAPLSPTTRIDINYIPPQVEVITINTGSGLSIQQDQYLTEIHAGTERSVHLDTTKAQAGNGSWSEPFNAVDLAVDYANTKNIHRIYVHAAATLDRNLEGFEIYGLSTPVLNLNGFSVDSTDFHNLYIAGSSTGLATYRHCMLLDGLSGLNGIYHECGIGGALTVQAAGYAVLSSCFCTVSNAGHAEISFGGAVCDLGVHSFAGHLVLKNGVTGCTATVGVTNGQVTLDSTIVDGNYHVHGLLKLNDNKTGGSLTSQDVLDPSAVIGEIDANEIKLDTIITALSSVGGLTQTQETMLQELWLLAGLDPAKPLNVTQSKITVSTDIDIDVTGDQQTSTTLSRN